MVFRNGPGCSTWEPPHAKWFVGGTLNASVNCVDRHVRGPRRNKAAIVWEGEPGDRRTLTYFDLYRQVSQFANVLKSLGIKRGDRVAIYLPLIPELAIAMLACARIGAVHSVVFGGFSSESLRDRINDAQASLLITADGGWRRGQVVPLKQMADEALEGDTVDQARDYRAAPAGCTRGSRQGRTRPLVSPLDARSRLSLRARAHGRGGYALHPLHVGNHGKPKGIVHTTGGYLVGTYATTKWVFDLKEDECAGVLPTSVGSPDTVMSSMARSRTGRPS